MIQQNPDIPKKGTPALDVIFAHLLLVATLSTAFCVYQATRWNGVQVIDFGESGMFRTESIRATTAANSQVIIDVQLFTGWVDATSKGDQREAEFLEERFREEFRPAFEAWIAKSNSTNPIPPGTPFDLPEYSPAKYKESALLEEQATTALTGGRTRIKTGISTSQIQSSLRSSCSSALYIHDGNQ